MDGHDEKPPYKDVCNGEAGHTKIIQIEYNTGGVDVII